MFNSKLALRLFYIESIDIQISLQSHFLIMNIQPVYTIHTMISFCFHQTQQV